MALKCTVGVEGGHRRAHKGMSSLVSSWPRVIKERTPSGRVDTLLEFCPKETIRIVHKDVIIPVYGFTRWMIAKKLKTVQAFSTRV